MYVTWKCTFAWFWVRPVVFFGAQRRLMLNLYIRSFPDAPGKLPDAPRKLPDAPATEPWVASKEPLCIKTMCGTTSRIICLAAY